ncbi:Putative F-box domain-containing protein [Septoria linicola]|uniref:F-box domain-containing protein n=1 Tax=Septoria linicola TaxID=215465 RepID=A0A9Q9AIJ4_9PEZI|nr:putative F-box domain-containing protein [Septoria linicola]USW49927.1 Putative F-box domain-containing protein [Septoria linicola]
MYRLTYAEVAAGKKPAPARTRTLHTNELLEAILSKLPPKDLLVLQRVDKCWRDTISIIRKTSRFRQAMFHEPEPRDIRMAMTYTPTLCFQKDCTTCPHYEVLARMPIAEVSQNVPHLVEARANSLLLMPPRTAIPIDNRADPRARTRFTFSRSTFKRLLRVGEHNPCWSMFLTNPPSTGLRCGLYQSPSSMIISFRDVFVNDGVRAKDVISCMKDLRMGSEAMLANNVCVSIWFEDLRSTDGSKLIVIDDQDVRLIETRVRKAKASPSTALVFNVHTDPNNFDQVDDGVPTPFNFRSPCNFRP